MIELKQTIGRVDILLVCIPMGDDLCIVITGGKRPHLGAVAVSQTRTSLKDKINLSASTSVMALLGHKEDELARDISQKITTHMGINTTVCCGIHLDNITDEELSLVFNITNKLTLRLLDILESNRGKGCR